MGIAKRNMIKKSIKRHGLYGSFNEFIGRSCLLFAIIVLIIMCLGVFAEIFSRNFGVALGWTKEVAIELMPFIAFLVAPFAYRRHLFAKIEILIDKLKGRTQYIFMLFVHIIELCILIAFAYYAYILFTTTKPQSLSGLTQFYRLIISPFIMAEELYKYRYITHWSYAFVFMSFIFMILVGFEHIGRSFNSFLKNKDCTTKRLFKTERQEQDIDKDDFLTAQAPYISFQDSHNKR